MSDFITNIKRFSETANLFDSNFTVKGVQLRKNGYFLNIFHQKKQISSIFSTKQRKI